MTESIKELRKICQTKKQPLYMEVVSMKMSIYITKLLLYTSMSADYVTMFMIVLILFGSIFMASGGLWHVLIGILIVHFTVILDNVNGEVARYRKEAGIIGTYLEEVYHNLSIPLIFFMLAYGVFLETGFKSVLIFGFLCSVFGRPIILIAVKEAVISERFQDISKKQSTKILVKKSDVNVKGGSAKTGQRLYRIYDVVREFWVFPANIVHITLISIIELINLRYTLFSSYDLFYLYLAFYGIASLIVQTASFVVNYKGRTVEHYYSALFSKK